MSQRGANVITDPRVKHFWDVNKIAGLWFAENTGCCSKVAWDIYFLYDGEAHWDSIPEPLVSFGATVIGKRQELQKNILPLLGVQLEVQKN